jgi:hypothetical protein
MPSHAQPQTQALAGQNPSVLPGLQLAEVEELQKLRSDFPYFCRRCLRIRTKTGEVVPFVLNASQLRLHEKLEAQKALTGRVRAIVVKARQVGISTMIQARYYHRLWRSKYALRAYILTHEAQATENLFAMAQRFHSLHPPALGQPPLERGNAKELLFADNQCGYMVATAGTKETGRSATFQMFHGSEVGLWPNAETHVDASFDAVGDVEGTEMILESTGKGVGNLFYRMAQAAIREMSQYIAVFIPWFWEAEYQTPCPEGWDPPPEWMQYGVVHGLTWEQLYWAFEKNREKANSISASIDKPCWKFRQEYPATFDEAFQSTGDSFIPPMHVLAARRPEEPIPGIGPVIIGVDPARSGDKIGIVDRCGRRAGERICEAWDPPGSVTVVAQMVARKIDMIHPDAVNIDMGGVGAGVYDVLTDMGYGYCLNAVNFGGNPIGTGPTGDDLYFNRRAEMWDLMRQWFNGDRPVQIPDDDRIQGDVCAPQWDTKNGGCRHNSNNELIMEEKDKIKARLGASPDLGDALALTFAVPFAAGMVAQNQPPPQKRGKRRTGY